MLKIEKLVKKAKKGNDKAFLKLFQTYEKEIYRTAFVYVNNQNDALDVVQETAYRAFKSIKNLKEPVYFKTWLFKIAINCAIDIIQKQKKIIPLKPEFEDMISGDPNEDVLLTMSLKDLLERLSEEEKSVILLRFYQDMTLKEVSETLRIPLGTAKTILYRALKKLRNSEKGAGFYGE